MTTPLRSRVPLLVVALVLALATTASAATYVIPHWIETSASTATSTYAFDDFVYARYTPGIAGTGSGGATGATVDLYLYDNSAGLPLTISGTQVCAPCSFDIGGGAPTRNVVEEIGQLIATRAGFLASAYVGYAVIVVRGNDPSGVTLENNLVNSHSSPFDIALTSFPPIRLRAEDPAYPAARVFSIPHMLEVSGATSSATYAFDETLFAVYTGGQAGTPGGAGANLSLYLYDESGGGLLMNNGTPVCAPCTYPVGGGSPRKLVLRMEDLVLAKGSFDTQVKRAVGVVVVGGTDPRNVTLQPWLINSHSSPMDLAMFAQTAMPVPSAGLLSVVEDDRPGRVSALTVSPNPAVNDVTIGFELAKAGDLEVSVFDVSGRKVRSVFQGHADPGTHQLHWDGRDDSGHRVEGGIYFTRAAGTDRSVFSRVVMMP